MKILVTGATGFIGTALVKQLEKTPGNQIIALTTKEINTTKSQTQYVICNMNSYHILNSLISDRDIDLCIHLAWAGNSGESRADRVLQINNVSNSMNLLDSLVKLGVKHFIGVGSIAEKDVLKYHLTDQATPNTVSIYAVSKIYFHMMSKIFCINNGIKYCWCTLGNVFGPGNHTKNITNYALDVFTSDKEPQFTKCEQLYDLVYIEDVVQALSLVIQNFSHEEYYVGSGRPRPLREYILQIKDMLGITKEPKFGSIPFNGISLSEEDLSIKNLTDIGYEPKYDFNEGIKQTIESWNKH